MDSVITFIKKHRFDIIVACCVIAFTYDVYFGKHTFSLTIVALYILGYAADAERSGLMLPKGKASSQKDW